MNKILIVIVIYGIDYKDSQAFKILKTQSKDILVIDNSKNAREYEEDPSLLSYLHFPDNPGLSHAYNYAARYGLSKGYDWLFISDQDTKFDENIIEKYYSYINSSSPLLICCHKIMTEGKLLSPVPLRYFFPTLQQRIPAGSYDLPINRYAVINSGLLVNIGLFLKSGGYNENVFLDFSDFQFFEKLQKIYGKIHVIDCVSYQEFSNHVQTKEQKINRFALFCRSLRNFETDSGIKRILVYMAMIKRALSLTVNLRTIKPLTVLFRSFRVCLH